MRKPEILAPAGNLEKLKIAVIYGADAVYLGGEQYSLRAAAGNFSLREMAEGVEFAHRYGRKVYVAVNIFAHNRDLAELPGYLKEIAVLGVDGLIISDPGVLALARETVPELPVHLSTQANTTNWASVRFWQEQGVKRVVLARELSLEEIKTIRERTSVELEAFVHGAMCMAYSGRCLLSSFFTGRSANRGACTHPCRWRYHLVEETRPGRYLPVTEDERGTYILSPRDLCMIAHIPDLARAGLDSWKIEGRMKSIHYVATVVKTYREALDLFWEDPERYRFRPEWLSELKKVSDRGFTTGFYFGQPHREEPGKERERPEVQFVGLVLDHPFPGLALVEQRNHFRVGDVLEVLEPEGEPSVFRLEELYDEAGAPLEAAPHARQRVYLAAPKKLTPYSLLRRRVESDA
ncbi:MAG TPA: U32 family peptidase [Clostridia bacterium]|nr:U32 family peptidase [Clostridia bacterium]